jgi:hypothetical protein
MFDSSFLRAWVIGFGCCAIVASTLYFSPFSETPSSGSPFAWLLWPGVFLWVQLNGGGFLFAPGFGDVGDFAVMALGSALAWSIPIPFVAKLVSRVRVLRSL